MTGCAQLGIDFGALSGARSFTSGTGASLSPCGLYRYRLWRTWGDPSHRVLFIGVNPSTADATKDDPTIRKEVGFAKRWGFGALDKVNLFGFRSTDVRVLSDVSDPIGPDNDLHFRAACAVARRIVYAWGKHPPRIRSLVKSRLDSLGWIGRLRTGCEVGTLGHNADGSPRHPLMLAYETPWVPL